MALAPERPSGHVLGLHASGMLTARGVGAALAGAAAEHMPSSTAMALTAAARRRSPWPSSSPRPRGADETDRTGRAGLDDTAGRGVRRRDRYPRYVSSRRSHTSLIVG
ncbi:hypothetical protein [Streptomyces sp. NPDC056937]|uniref:hypothetical protein n=1 Tax=Streptomyces sp. NPDC056937 TaxID=3345969 RepID=UPI003634955D